MLGAFSPAIAAILVRGRILGKGSPIRASGPFSGTRAEYLFGLVLPLPVAIVVIALAAVLGLSTVHTELDPMILIGGLIGALLLGVSSIGEEFGWRGYLQIRWFAEQPARAAVATGIVWGIFHYPVILIGLEGYENVAIGLVVFTAFTIARIDHPGLAHAAQREHLDELPCSWSGKCTRRIDAGLLLLRQRGHSAV